MTMTWYCHQCAEEIDDDDVIESDGLVFCSEGCLAEYEEDYAGYDDDDTT